MTDFSGLNEWVEIFKAGKHAGKGDLTSHEFSTADLDQMVANFKPTHPVPHVITHQELYSPFAYAQAVELKREGDSLYARSDKINPAFEQLIKDGSLYNRSVRIMQTGQGFELGHIAWLGAEPPAVQGLAPVSFSSDEAGTDFMLGNRPTDSHTGGDNMPGYTQEQLDAAVAKAAEAQTINVSAAEAQTEQLKAEFARKEAALQAELLAERNAKAKSEWDGKIKAAITEGRLTPAQAAGMSEFALALPENVLEFSQGTGQQMIKTGTRAWFADFVAKLPKQVAMSADAKSSGGAEQDDWKTDATKIAAKAVEYKHAMAGKGTDLSYAAAVAYVMESAV